jgi:hypothetical protein
MFNIANTGAGNFALLNSKRALHLGFDGRKSQPKIV